LPYDDPLLLEYIRNYHLLPPPSGPYKLTKAPMILHPFVKRALKDTLGRELKEGGFFIEAGAHDGEFRSNTIELEVDSGWNGLLIEAMPSFFAALRKRNRARSWHSDVCLSSRPDRLELFRNTGGNPGGSRLEFEGKLPFEEGIHVSEGKVDCLPLASVLVAMNVSTVDFLALDVEGNEFKVLTVFPFDRIDVKVIRVEWMNIPEGKETLAELLKGKGYEEQPSPEAHSDFLFVKKERIIKALSN